MRAETSGRSDIKSGPPQSLITTTTIGAYPKPDYVPITDWFSADVRDGELADYTSAYADQLAAAGDDAESRFRRATAEIIADQVDAGIDVITDGEVRRENYVHYQCRHFSGFDFETLSERRIRGAVDARLPTVRDNVSFDDSPLVRDFDVAQSLSAKPVKMTLPGPMTIIHTTVDAHYHDDLRLGADLAAALNAQIHALVDAGCRHIQVDEPIMARKPDIALAHGIDQLAACFDGVPDTITRTVHCCCGYPNRLDQEDYPKADLDAYLRLAAALDDTCIDQVSIEDAHRPNDLAQLLPLFTDTTVILGLIAIARTRVETVDAVAERLDEARWLLPDGHLVAAPDCGLGYLPRELARQKLRVLTEAVANVNGVGDA